tara:strand:- start:1224 stop:1745 length:522 start_codon:yes stop_codon:yes gene_type:complete
MRIDHIAYRVADRHKAVKFFQDALGYTVSDDFEIKFDNGSTAKCFALKPPEADRLNYLVKNYGSYHLAPEIFVSDGEEGSIVYNWVKEKGEVGGIHHIAYEVDSVEKTMKEWSEKGYAEFTTEEPLTCPGLTQCFTKPSLLTGIIYEFIERDASSQGFCKDNVKDLMESTEGL